MAHPSSRDPFLETLVAASLLRLGSDTRAARLFAECRRAAPEGAPPFHQLSQALEPRVDRRAAAECRVAEEARAALVRAEAFGMRAVGLGQPDYPETLGHIIDPPIVLWHTGASEALNQHAVALVGSRSATPAGLALARHLGAELARAGLAVVSGLARGIDAAAHEGALSAGGRTIAVLGCGVDVVYPRQHAELVRRVRQQGAVVSEYPPGTSPLPRHFPLRNRIISGLSLAVVVVEAAQKSGSLITARAALEQGREVLAVPGPVVSGCHQGCHALIKDGAGLVETAADVLSALGLARPDQPAASREKTGLIAQMAPGGPLTVDQLAARVGRKVEDVLAELAVLEVEGVVARMAGGLVVRLD